MIEQMYKRLYPEPQQPEPMTLEEQQAVVTAARRLAHAVREYLYHHGSFGPVGQVPDGDSETKKRDHKKRCVACRELQDALDES